MSPEAYLRHAFQDLDLTALPDTLLQTAALISPVVLVALAGLTLLYAGGLGLSLRTRRSGVPMPSERAPVRRPGRAARRAARRPTHAALHWPN